MRFREFAQLLFELNVSTRRRAIARFKAENPQLTDDEITYMLDKWERYINRMPADVRDINTVSWQQLATAVDDAEALANLKRHRGQPDSAELEPIYDHDNLVIYRGDSKPKCIHYGQGYTWCISRTDASNLFYNYRHDKSEPMFYFVFDRDRSKEDEWHAVVIHVSQDGKFTVTTSFNRLERSFFWNELVRYHPKLADLKHVFQPQPLTDQEREDYDRFSQPMSTEQFRNLTVREKIKAVEFGMPLTDEQQALLPYAMLELFLANNPLELNRGGWLRLKLGDFRYGLRKVFDLWSDVTTDESIFNYLPEYFDPAYNDQHRQAILHQFVTGPNADASSAMFYLEHIAYQRNSEGLDRWPAAEHVIATSGSAAFYYAEHALQGRWPEPHRDTAERNIARMGPPITREYSQLIGMPEHQWIGELKKSRSQDIDQHPPYDAEEMDELLSMYDQDPLRDAEEDRV